MSTDDGVPLTPAQRQSRIAALVHEQGPQHVEELAVSMDVSPMTVYRDLLVLQRSGVLQRSQGLVTAVRSSLNETTSQFRMTQNTDAKEALAAVARRFVAPGSSVMLDDSTTDVWVLRAIADITPLTVVTPSQAVAREAQGMPGVTLFLAGGVYHQWADAFYGPTTTRVLAGMRADVCIMSATGVSDGVVYHPDEQVVQVKRALLAGATRRILLLDRTKFDRVALHVVGSLEEFDTVVAGPGTGENHLSMLRESGVEVLLADEPRR